MMKSLLAGFAMLLLGNSASAEQTEILHTLGPCISDRTVFEKTVDNYGEMIFTVGAGNLAVAYRDTVFPDQIAIIETWLNPETRTFTISAYFFDDNTTCVLLSGSDWSYVE